MTCSWTQSFITGLKELEIHRDFCFSNWWVYRKYSPLGKHDYNLLITIKEVPTEDRFRLGFNLIVPYDQTLDRNISDSLKNMKHQVWSNPVSF